MIGIIWINKDEYLNDATSAGTSTSVKICHSIDEDIENALFLWLMQARSVGVLVSGHMVKEKAKAMEVGHSDFIISGGWQDRFKSGRESPFE